MKINLKRVISTAAAFVVGTTSTVLPKAVENLSVNANAASGVTLEYLDRGISAINTGNGMLVSWRYLANDDDNAVYELYRDGSLIYTSKAGQSTCYLDAQGSASSKYRVDTLSGGKVVGSEDCKLISNNTYFDIPLTPPTSKDCTYSPNDMSVGDIDGDGQYELFLKWDPSNSQDNSKGGYTGNVYIDCIRLDGTRVWRIDLGKNIRAGAHYTQFYVADFDLDGKAEMTCKTADGTVDGTGKVIGDASKDYRNSSGYILSGPEYYTLFDGATGAALDTVDYVPQRGEVSKKTWGDDYGNRVDRFWGTVAYIDGVHPCVVTGRGYYTRMTATCYGVENKKLVQKWAFDTGFNSSAAGYGDGNHNSMPADVDGDGKQEIITGSTCIDDNGKVLWCTNQGHGDAMHLADLDPTKDGLELWICHEEASSGYGVSLIEAKNGNIIYHINADKDTGRCAADNIYAGNPGAELWGARPAGVVLDTAGNTINGLSVPAMNFFSYWDGDLERELLDGGDNKPATITKMMDNGKITTLLTTDGFVTNNSTKANPCLSADIFGDWREELIVRASDNKSVRIYCTPYDTDYRITTLMHDAQYRMQVSSQNTSYNQPPHTSFFLGTGYDLPKRPTDTVLDKSGTAPVTPSTNLVAETFISGSTYKIKNVNSGLYMQVNGAKAENGANVQQWGTTDDTVHDIWKLVDAGDGYYYIVSAVGDGGTYVLDVEAKKTDNNTNIEIYSYTGGDNQKFMFTKNSDGSYKIRPKHTNAKSAVEIAGASTSSGANVQQYEINGANCQDWILEKVSESGCKMDTSVIYEFENVNSGMVMEIKDGKTESGANVQQWEKNGLTCQQWQLKESASGGNYYYICSVADPTYVLKVSESGNGGNIAVETYSENDNAMLFKFIKNLDGTYQIMTKESDDTCYVEVGAASKTKGANIQQWENTDNDCQKWSAETLTTSATTTTTKETTTTTTETTTTKEATTATTETTTSVVSDVLIGDANCDGAVNIADATAIVQHLGNQDKYGLSEKGLINADCCNVGDGVTGLDALAIQKLEAGIISSLPDTN
ncbi:MAG: RICIN domain-containing protein [Ruminococcus sp.]|nr:RICIN domain-containing protein [Ruminococcus sp.]